MASNALLRWAGSKRQLVPQLAEYWPGGRTRYVEPFAGSAALFFHLAPEQALLGDLNCDLIATYRTVRRVPSQVARTLLSMPPADAAFYYSLRGENPSELSAVHRAARFIYLNRFCFNGLYRTNLQGKFNVPFSGSRNGPLPSAETIQSVARILRSVRLICGDFTQTLRQVRDTDFVYMDPPYWVSNRRVFREYSSTVFDDTHICRLKTWLSRLTARRIAFVLSYAESEQALALAKGLKIREVSVKRNIAGFSASRRRATELLIVPPYL